MTMTTTIEGDTMKTTTLTAQELFEAAFTRSRDPRSDAYKAGVLYVLRTRVDGAPVGSSSGPYPPGSAEADAYHAGCSEGHHIAEQVGAPVRVVRR